MSLSKLGPDTPGDVATVQLVNSTPAYAVLDRVGADTLEIANAARYTGGGGMIHNVALISKVVNLVDVAFHFFSSDPGSGTDNAALSLTDTNVADYYLFTVVAPRGSNQNFALNIAQGTQCKLRYKCDATSLYVIPQMLIASGAYSSTSDLVLKVGYTRD